MDFYPPGLAKLPDEEKVPCDECGANHYYYQFKSCYNCEESTVCPSCHFCISCGRVN